MDLTIVMFIHRIIALPAGLKPAPLATDAQALAKRLERKIENLTKIGGQLQTDNKGIYALFK